MLHPRIDGINRRSILGVLNVVNGFGVEVETPFVAIGCGESRFHGETTTEDSIMQYAS